MSNDIELRERELINALEFYGIKSSSLDKAKDITWLTKENARHFLDTNKRENSNRYFSVIKSNQHKLDLVKPFLSKGTEGLGGEIKVEPTKKSTASTSKITEEDQELYDALIFYGINYDTLEKARDVIWLKREFAKASLSRSDKGLAQHYFNVIKSEQAKLKTFKRKFVAIDSEVSQYQTSRPQVEEKSFDEYVEDNIDVEDDMDAFRRKVRQGMDGAIISKKINDNKIIDETIEDIMGKDKEQDKTIERNFNDIRRFDTNKKGIDPWAVIGFTVLGIIGIIFLIGILNAFDYDDDDDDY